MELTKEQQVTIKALGRLYDETSHGILEDIIADARRNSITEVQELMLDMYPGELSKFGNINVERQKSKSRYGWYVEGVYFKEAEKAANKIMLLLEADYVS